MGCSQTRFGSNGHVRNFQGLYDCCPFPVSGYHQAAPSLLLIEITARKTHFEGKTGEVCGCPCGRLGTGGHGDLWAAPNCLLFLRPVGHASHGACQLAWPGSESRLSHKWKHQTGHLKAGPWFLHGTRVFSVYPAGLSCPTYFIVRSTDLGHSVHFLVNLLP